MCAEGFVEFNRRFVPVQHAPFETAAVIGTGDFCQVAQQGFTGAAAPLFRGDVEVFEVQAIAAQPGGIAEEEHREADRQAIAQADQAMGGGAFAEQAALDVGDAGDDFVAGTFEVGQFSDEREDLRSIAGGCRADFDRHGRALSKVENAILSPRAALVTFEMMEGAFVANVDSLSNLSRNTLSVAAASQARQLLRIAFTV
ncbi:hypothetical protein EMIT0194MI4_60229 [Pseudomonas sp. IT-194MI4]